MKDLRGKVAVITGGAEGIGKAIAVRAAGEGMKLVLADINPEKLQETVAEFSRQGVAVIGERVDVSKITDIERLAERAYHEFGAVHLLVNNAGVALCKSAWETTIEDWDWVLGVNLNGIIFGVRTFVPRMLAGAEEGHIVNTSSAAGFLTAPGLAAYNVSKFGVVALSEALHHDFVARGAKIGVSVLCPAWVKTRIAEAERNREGGDRMETLAPEPIALKSAIAIMQAVQSGIPPETVADQVFDAIVNGSFYIITHPRTDSGIRTRLEDVLTRRPPTFLSL